MQAEDVEKRRDAIVALASIRPRGHRVLQNALEPLLRDTNPHVRVCALYALVRHEFDSPSARRMRQLFALASHGDPAVRLRVVRLLAQMGAPRTVLWTLEKASLDEDAKVAAEAKKAVDHIRKAFGPVKRLDPPPAPKGRVKPTSVEPAASDKKSQPNTSSYLSSRSGVFVQRLVMKLSFQ